MRKRSDAIARIMMLTTRRRRLSIRVDGLGEKEQLEQLHQFAEDIIPVLRREIPSTIWQQGPNLDDGSRSIIV